MMPSSRTIYSDPCSPPCWSKCWSVDLYLCDSIRGPYFSNMHLSVFALVIISKALVLYFLQHLFISPGHPDYSKWPSSTTKILHISWVEILKHTWVTTTRGRGQYQRIPQSHSDLIFLLGGWPSNAPLKQMPNGLHSTQMMGLYT